VSSQSSDSSVITLAIFYMYIIKSLNFDSYYTGQCSDIKIRLERHNGGHSKSTKAKAPWKLIYFEEFQSRSEAVRREREVKSKKSRRYIETLVDNFNIQSDLGL